MDTLESVRRAAQQRLYPSLTDPSWLVLRRRREIFRRWISEVEGKELDVLDVGGRIQPYRPLLEGRVRRYIAIDLRRTPVVDAVARGEQLPFASEHFDLVMCTQVLEYVQNPSAVFSEIYRVLRPNGRLLLTAPAMAIRDSDEECYRFFPFALRTFLGGFAHSEIVPEGASIIGFFRLLNSGLDTFVRYSVVRGIFRWTLCPIINVSAEMLNWIARSENDQFANNYAVWSRK